MSPLDLHRAERRATVRVEQAALIAILWGVRAWHLAPEWMHRATQRPRRRA